MRIVEHWKEKRKVQEGTAFGEHMRKVKVDKTQVVLKCPKCKKLSNVGVEDYDKILSGKLILPSDGTVLIKCAVCRRNLTIPFVYLQDNRGNNMW